MHVVAIIVYRTVKLHTFVKEKQCIDGQGTQSQNLTICHAPWWKLIFECRIFNFCRRKWKFLQCLSIICYLTLILLLNEIGNPPLIAEDMFTEHSVNVYMYILLMIHTIQSYMNNSDSRSIHKCVRPYHISVSIRKINLKHLVQPRIHESKCILKGKVFSLDIDNGDICLITLFQN